MLPLTNPNKQRDPNIILIGVCLRSGDTRWETSMSLIRLISEGIPGMQFEIVPAGGGDVCHARNLIFHYWRTRSAAGRMIFIDSDIVFSAAHLLQLLQWDLPFVAGMYPLKDTYFRWSFNGESNPWERDGRLLSVFEVCTGFLLINYSVLEALIDPADEFDIEDAPYKGEVGYETLKMCLFKRRRLSEDFYLSMLVREKLKLPILIDPRVQCGHIGQFNYLQLLTKEQPVEHRR